MLHTGEPLPVSATDDLLRQIREERDLANLGDGFVEDARSGSSKPAHQTGRSGKSSAKK